MTDFASWVSNYLTGTPRHLYFEIGNEENANDGSPTGGPHCRLRYEGTDSTGTSFYHPAVFGAAAWTWPGERRRGAGGVGGERPLRRHTRCVPAAHILRRERDDVRRQNRGPRDAKER
jgi:hypothetical protein